MTIPPHIRQDVECLQVTPGGRLPEAVKHADAVSKLSDRQAGRDPWLPWAVGFSVMVAGGTTAAALAVLMRPNGLLRLMSEAIAAATARSRELAG